MRCLSAIQAITFDVGGTLIEPWPSVGQIYAEAARRHGMKKVASELLNKRFKQVWTGLTAFNHSRDDWAQLVDQVFCGLCPQPPSQTFFPELYERFAQPDAWRIFDDVLPALDALAAKGLKLGLISNWDERLRPLLRGLDLEKYFQTVIISCEVGFPKPAKVIFDAASEKLGVAHGSILHAGDSLASDFEGARSAGFEAVLLRRGNGAVRDGEITSLCELTAG